MTRRGWASTIALAAVCVAMATTPASAVRAILLQPGGEIKKTVEAFRIRAFGGEVTITCELTLLGRLTTAPIEKASAGLLPQGRMGRIEEAFVEGCGTNIGTPAELTVLVEPGAPRDLRYQGFLGVLPNITGIQFRKLAFAFRIEEPFILGTCLYRGMVDLLMSFPPVEGGGGNRYTPERFVVPNAVPRVSPAPCPETVEVSGVGRITPAQTAVLVN